MTILRGATSNWMEAWKRGGILMMGGKLWMGSGEGGREREEHNDRIIRNRIIERISFNLLILQSERGKVLLSSYSNHFQLDYLIK